MDICHRHNLVADRDDEPKPFGIRLTLPAQDTFRSVLGENWEKYHWFSCEAARDAGLQDMQRQHEYSRAGDLPSVIFTKVSRDESGKITAD